MISAEKQKEKKKKEKKRKENLENELNEVAVDNPILNLAFKWVVEVDVAHQTFSQIVGKQNSHLLQLLLCPSDL